MTEQRPPYEVEDSTENAMAMLGSGYDQPTVVIDPPRKTVVRRKGKMVEEDEPAWVKFSTGFKKELADLGEYSLKVFLYIGLSVGFETGSSHPGIRKIAEDTGMAQNTAIKAVKELEDKGFLAVERRDKKSNIYMPIRYISVGKTASPDEAEDGEAQDKLPHEIAKLPHQNDKLPHESTVKLLNKKNKIEQEIDDSKFPIEWQILSGKEVTEEHQKAASLSEEAIRTFEKDLGFGVLSWEQNNDWVAFRKFVEKVYAKDKTIWSDYAKWREGDGKYGKAMTNNAIRKNPKMFIDTGYPTYEASKMYRKDTQPEYKKVVADENDEKGVPNPFGRPKGVRPVIQRDRQRGQSIVE